MRSVAGYGVLSSGRTHDTVGLRGCSFSALISSRKGCTDLSLRRVEVQALLPRLADLLFFFVPGEFRQLAALDLVTGFATSSGAFCSSMPRSSVRYCPLVSDIQR